MAPHSVDEDGDEWWERREGDIQAGGSLLEHDDATDEGGPEGGIRADGEGDETGLLGGDEMRHPQ
jgi:hypothetical protein